MSPNGIDYSQIQLTLKRNDTLVYEGAATNVLEDPRESLRQLANRLHRAGTPLERGPVVLTGSVVGAYKGTTFAGNLGLYLGEATGLPPVELHVE